MDYSSQLGRGVTIIISSWQSWCIVQDFVNKFINIFQVVLSRWKLLGIKITKDLKLDTHITHIIRKVSGRLFMLTTLRFGLKIEDVVKIYIRYIRPHLEYTVPVWNPGLTTRQHNSLERIQKRACKTIMGNKCSSYQQALKTYGMQVFQARREHQCLKFAQSQMKSDVFCSWLPNQRGTDSGHLLHNSYLLTLRRARTQRDDNRVSHTLSF